ncbi:carbohydrate-binding domain-containing protein [Cohnella sp. GCM10027633]|uniref:carbohydrate-binding domain-containing protein n=1 Tax=unclassified Cohnella TaxID=2636738 RepID=UPI0036455861
MKKSNGLAMTMSTLLLCAALVSACSNNAEPAASAVAETEATAGVASGSGSGEQLASVDLAGETLVEYKEEDAYTDWESGTVTTIALNGSGASIDGSGAEAADGSVTITAAGTYVASGKLDDGQLLVDVPDKGDVRVVLNGVDIHNGDSSAIYVAEAGKLILSLPEGAENVVSDGEKYVYPDDATDEPNAAIFSHDDLTINGTGKLTVKGNYNNGIASKDKLKITGGSLNVTAVDDGVMGRDLVGVKDGDLTVDAGGHAVKTTNDTAGEEGMIAISGGAFSLASGEDALHSAGGIQITSGELAIQAGDDGINADIAIAITGGTIGIAESNEGIEAPQIHIAGGEISVASGDDGINVSSGSGETEAMEGPPGQGGANSSNLLKISGGTLRVDAQGDGLDANGSIEMSGGTVVVNGPTNNGNGALDYDGTFVMTGGYLVAAGSSGMVQAASDASTQYGILMTYPQAQEAGTLVHLESEDGTDVLTFAPSKSYQAVFVGSPELKKDGSYTLYSGGTSSGGEANGLYEGGAYTGGTEVVSFQIADIVTWLDENGVTEARSGMGGPGGGGFGGGGGGRGQGGPRGEGGGFGGRMPPDGEMPQGGQGGMPVASDAGDAQGSTAQ